MLILKICLKYLLTLYTDSQQSNNYITYTVWSQFFSLKLFFLPLFLSFVDGAGETGRRAASENINRTGEMSVQPYKKLTV